MLPATRRALAITAISYLTWTSFYLARANHAYGDLSRAQYSDHFSHMNAARAFPRLGLDLWRKSIAQLFRSMTPAELARLPKDIGTASGPEVRFVAGWRYDKPMVTSWSQNPRLYPPGDLVLVAPVALAYHFTSLSFATANKLLVLLFLLLAHLGIFVLLWTGQDEAQSPFALLIIAIVYLEMVHWSLEGFYDAAVIAPLLLSGRARCRKEGLATIFWFCVAAVIHFRALFFAPLAIEGAYRVVIQRDWKRWQRRQWLAVFGIVIMTVATLLPLYLLLPVLSKLPVSNSINYTHGWSIQLKATLLLMLLPLGAAVWARAWFEIAELLWFVAMLMNLREAYLWHVVALLPFATLPVGGDNKKIAVVRDSRMLFFIAVMAMVFRGNALTPTWLTVLF